MTFTLPPKHISDYCRSSCHTGEGSCFAIRREKFPFLGFCPGVSCVFNRVYSRVLQGSILNLVFYFVSCFSLLCSFYSHHFFLYPVSQGALEEQLALSGDGTYNAHFGESIASVDDLDDDGFPGEKGCPWLLESLLPHAAPLWLFTPWIS